MFLSLICSYRSLAIMVRKSNKNELFYLTILNGVGMNAGVQNPQGTCFNNSGVESHGNSGFNISEESLFCIP